MLADPLTKTCVPKDITDRLSRLLEESDMDFTQTDFMKSKKERSRDQAKERKTLKQSLKAIKGESAHMCIEGYGEFSYGNSSSNENSEVHDSQALAAVEDLDNRSNCRGVLRWRTWSRRPPLYR